MTFPIQAMAQSCRDRVSNARHSYDLSDACSVSSGLILCSMWEYATLATTHEASGAAAADALFAFLESNESRFDSSSFSTESLLASEILRASKNRMSSLTPLLARNVFMLFHDVSCMPISRSTPSSMSLITSGGARSDLISVSASDLMLLTAAWASSIRGSTCASSWSISFFLNGYMVQIVTSFIITDI